jgi:hypothetical protein
MRYALLLLTFILAACGANIATPAPTATNNLATTAAVPAIGSAATLVLPILPTATPAPPATAPPATAQPATSSEQYRAWMDEARIRHPYGESVEQMWEVMMCESSGDPNTIAGAHHGLFQYSVETWAGDWNPYRDSPILDPQAQIFATAKAWHDGYQSWWGCYR